MATCEECGSWRVRGDLCRKCYPFSPQDPEEWAKPDPDRSEPIRNEGEFFERRFKLPPLFKKK